MTMMNTAAEWTARKNDHVRAAKAITDAADAEGRGLTSAEQKQISDHVAAAREANEKAKEKLGAAQMIEELSVLGATGSVSAPGKARTAGPWAKAAIDALPGVGRKELTSSGTVTMPSLSSTLIADPDRARTALGLIPVTPLDGTDTFSYLRATNVSKNASTVAPGKLKPTSTAELERIEDRLRTVATLLGPVKRQDLADQGAYEQFIDDVLRVAVLEELEAQVLLGDGSTAGVLDNFDGILETSGIQGLPFDTDRLVTARKAVTLAERTDLPIENFSFVMTPEAWETFELMRSDESFLLSEPGSSSGGSLPISRARRELWGRPVVTSTVMPGDSEILLGDFRSSVELRERTGEGVRVDWSEAVPDGEGNVGFSTNTFHFRCEGRWGLAVLRPAAFITAEIEPSGS